jgi:hypothetical protein
VRGAVKGDLVGEEAVLLEEGARVVGDVRAPRVAIQGALVRGYVQTGEGDGSGSRTARTHTAARPAAAAQPQPRAAVAKAPALAVPLPPPKAAAKPAVPPRVGARAANATDGAGPRRPPPPVVPALKKAKGQIAKKKER